ncbi:MAG: Hsp70 family protein, partial [Candidatus Cloacimonetes bacterium]|nr:Hsp70 family protein [Candidatus Cloacimonadota bacterium]
MERQVSWFGIDFGTTNSAASSLTGTDELSVKQINYGDDEGRPFPSLVAININTGEVITGREAKERKNELSSEYKFFSSIKSIIGSNEVYEIAGKKWNPIDVAAEIFKGLKERIKARSGERCSEAIVAVPVGFTSEKKCNLREAAKRAGIEIKMFISEPTAAFCSNYVNLKGNRNVAVFDWGGGTLDVAVLRIENGRIYEMATDGMNMAGDNIDQKIADKIHQMVCKEKNIAISFEELDDATKDQLLMRCEKAKCEFSDGEDIVKIRINRYDKYGTVREEMTYDFFEKLVETEVNEAVGCLESAIKKAGFNIENIDKILCVGGSSKLRPFREKMEKRYNQDLLYYPDKVMWDIAKGASIICMSSGGYGLNQDLG